MKPRRSFLRFSSLGFLFSLFTLFSLFSCNSQPQTTPEPTLALGAWLASGSPTPQALPTEVMPTPTGVAQKVILINSSQPTSQTSQAIATLQELALQDGLQVEERSIQDLKEIPSNTRLVVLFGTVDGANELVNAAVQTHFLAFDAAGLEDAPNLTSASLKGLEAEKIDFLAGYVAAVVTTHWRIGVIGSTGSPSIAGFKRGAVFFCGLCRSPYPPFVSYPVVGEVSGGQNDFQSVIDNLKQSEVKTVYVSPGAESADLFNALAQAGINIIAAQRAPQGLGDHWVVSLQAADPQEMLKNVWQTVTSEQKEAAPAPAVFQDVNPQLFSAGRQILVNTMLNELQNGTIGTGGG